MKSAPTLRILRTVRFSAGHRYHNPAWSDEQNQRVFGVCNRPHGHGHNYRLEVGVDGSVDPVTGMLINLADLDTLLKDLVLSQLDHAFLNHDVEHFAEVNPTCENIAAYLWQRLEEPVARLGACRLSLIRLWESEDLFAELSLEARS